MPTITGYLSVKLAQSAWRQKSLVCDLINTQNMKYAQNFGSKTKVSNQISSTLGHLNEIATDRKYRGRMMVITQ